MYVHMSLILLKANFLTFSQVNITPVSFLQSYVESML